MINLSFLHTFLVLCEQKNFTAVARKLNMTQPGVSRHLKSLEQYFMVELVQRSQGSFVLTEKGEFVYEYAKKLFREHEAFKNELIDEHINHGVCRFSAPGSFGMKMYSFLLSYNKARPGLSIHFAYAPNQSIIKDVLNDIVDIGFVTVNPLDQRLVAEQYDQEKLCLITPKDFDRADFSSLLELGFINHPDGFHHASRLLKANFSRQFNGMEEFPLRGFINQITRIPEPVAQGIGFTALPEYACRSFSHKNLLRFLPLQEKIIDPIYWQNVDLGLSSSYFPGIIKKILKIPL